MPLALEQQLIVLLVFKGTLLTTVIVRLHVLWASILTFKLNNVPNVTLLAQVVQDQEIMSVKVAILGTI